MQYRSDRKGTKLSVLGYGCLRFTKENGKIDIDKTEKEIMEAIRSGVNYFDTAYVYGGSEAALGEILARNGVREQVYIATKLPHYLIKSKAGLEKCFQEQLKRLRTDHVDYYLMHMLNDVQTWQGLCAKGVDQWIREKQASGQITETVLISRSFWMHMTGISARCSIIIWMSIPRRGGKAFSMQKAKEFRSLSWNLCEAED